MNRKIECLSKEREYVKTKNGNFRTEQYDSHNRKFTGQTKQENGINRGKEVDDLNTHHEKLTISKKRVKGDLKKINRASESCETK